MADQRKRELYLWQRQIPGELMAVSAQATTLVFNGTQVSELGDLTPPVLGRKTLDRTMLSDTDDEYQVGIRRHGLMQFRLNFLPDLGDPFVQAWVSGTVGSFVLTFADGAIWSFEGNVVDVEPHCNFEDVLYSVVSVQPTSLITFGASHLLLETGDRILLEDGSGTLLME